MRALSTKTYQDRFLTAFAHSACITHAAAAAQVARTMHYRWLEDADYAERFAAAKDEAIEALEVEARRRAIEGTPELVIHEGQPVFVSVDDQGQVVPDDDPAKVKSVALHKTKQSDTLMIFLLKAARPAVYRDRIDHQHSGPGGGPIQTTLTLQTVMDELDARDAESQ